MHDFTQKISQGFIIRVLHSKALLLKGDLRERRIVTGVACLGARPYDRSESGEA